MIKKLTCLFCLIFAIFFLYACKGGSLKTATFILHPSKTLSKEDSNAFFISLVNRVKEEKLFNLKIKDLPTDLIEVDAKSMKDDVILNSLVNLRTDLVFLCSTVDDEGVLKMLVNGFDLKEKRVVFSRIGTKIADSSFNYTIENLALLISDLDGKKEIEKTIRFITNNLLIRSTGMAEGNKISEPITLKLNEKKTIESTKIPFGYWFTIGDLKIDAEYSVLINDKFNKVDNDESAGTNVVLVDMKDNKPVLPVEYNYGTHDIFLKHFNNTKDILYRAYWSDDNDKTTTGKFRAIDKNLSFFVFGVKNPGKFSVTVRE